MNVGGGESQRRNEIDLDVLRNGSYPSELTRELFVIVKEDGSIAQEAGEAYADMMRSKQGQDILKDEGFLPIYEVDAAPK